MKSGYCKTHLRTNLYKIDANGNSVRVNSENGPLNINDMYSTVIRKDHSFSNRGIMDGEWKITVEQITRWRLKEENTKFGLLLTIIDPKNDPKIDIYSSIQSDVPNRYATEITSDVLIRI